MPFRIIREAIGRREGKSEADRETKREKEKGNRDERTKKREEERQTEKESGETEREKGAPGCYSVLLLVYYFLSFREGPKKSSHAARERDPEHARRQARTNARTHARTHPSEGSRKPAAREGS